MNEVLITNTSFDSWTKLGELYVCTEKSCCKITKVLKPETLVVIRLVLPNDNLVVQGTIIAIETKSILGTKVVVEGTLQDLNGAVVKVEDREIGIGVISTAPLNSYTIARKH